MFTPIGNPRGLPYPLRNQVSNDNVVSDLGLTVNDFIWPEDPEERTLLPLWVSQHEFTAISSAMDVGADIAYPVQYIEVMWILMRNLRYNVPICSALIDCINNDVDTKQAIIDALLGSEEFKDYISESVRGLTTGQIVGPLVAGSCDESVVAGKMIALVEALDTNNSDALEIVEVGTNDEEKVAALLEGIPIVDELPFGDIIDFLQDLLEDFGENYNAASTTERKDELARDLWCFALQKEDCALSFADLFEFFNDRVSSGLTLGSLVENIVQWVALGDFGTDQLVFDGMMFLQIAFTRVGKEFFGINVPKIGALTRDASPSSAWEGWDPCGPPTELPIVIYDVGGYTGGTYDPTSTSSATFTAGLGSDGAYRVFFAFTTASKSQRVTSLDASISFAPGFEGYYPDGCDVVSNGYLVCGVGAPAPIPGCYNALTFTAFTPFTIDIVFEDC